MDKRELYRALEELFSRRDCEPCWFDVTADCMPWEICLLLDPECPLVKLGLACGFPFAETANSAAPTKAEINGPKKSH